MTWLGTFFNIKKKSACFFALKMSDSSVYSGEDEDLLYVKYKKHIYEFAYLIDSFNDFLENSIREILAGVAKYNQNGDKFEIVLRGIDKPMYKVSGVETNLTRQTCMAHDKNYSGKVHVAIRCGNIESSEATLLEIPIMVYSNRCHDYNDRDADPGCYFIIGGNRYVCFLYETGRCSQMNVGVEKGKFYVTCAVEYANSRTSFNVVKFDNTNVIQLKTNAPILEMLEDDDVDDIDGPPDVEKTDETGKKKVVEVFIPAINAAYIIHVTNVNDEDVMTLKEFADYFFEIIRSFTPEDHWNRVRDNLSTSFSDFEDCTEDDIINSLYKSLRKEDLSKDDWKLLGKQYFDNILVGHKTHMDKIHFIAMMMCRVCQAIAGFILPTSKDYGFTRAIHPPGRVFTKLLGRKINGLLRDQSIKIEGRIKDACENFASKLQEKSANTTKKFLNSLLGVGKQWNNKPWNNETTKAVLMLADVANDTSMRAMLTRTKNDANVNMRTLSAREVQMSYLFFVDILKFTDNEMCGFIKFLASLAYVTTYLDPSSIISILKQGYYVSLWRKERTDKFHLELKVGGKTIGYTSSESVAILDPILSSKHSKQLVVGDDVLGNVKDSVSVVKFLREVKLTLVQKKRTDVYNCPVTVNTYFVGFANGKTIYDNLIMLKRLNKIGRMTSVVLSQSGTLEICTDGGRLVVPMMVVDKKQRKPKIYTDTYKDIWKSMTIDQMLLRGLIEYVDGYEIENKNLTIAQGFGDINNKLKDLSLYKEHLHTLKKNSVAFINYSREIKVIEKRFFSYVPLHPLAIYSSTMGELPYVNNHQACRSVFAEKIRGQAVGRDFQERGLYRSGFCTPYTRESHVAPMMAKYTGSSEGTYGETLNAVIMPDALNQEDAIILSKRAVDNGLRMYKIQVFKSELLQGEEFTRPELGKQHPSTMKYINANGAPTIGAYLNPGDVVIGKIHRDGTIINDMSEFMQRSNYGTVEEVLTYKNAKGNKVIKVVVKGYHKMKVGDKIASREGQKHIVVEIRNDEEMPWAKDPSIGRIDVIMNPLSLITRMTIGSLFELYGAAAMIKGQTMDITSHKNYQNDIAHAREILEEYGFSASQTAYFYNGVDGELMTTPLQYGTMRMQPLYHLAEDKIQCRGLDVKNSVTGQSLMTKAKTAANKGQKVAVQERDKLLGYKSAFFVADKMNISADGVKIVVCKTCSAWAHYSNNHFTCPTCNIDQLASVENNFYKYIEPQTTRYVRSLLLSLGHDIRPKFISGEEYLQKMSKIYREA